MTCRGIGRPVATCPCPFCKHMRPPVPAREPLWSPTGDFLEDDEKED